MSGRRFNVAKAMQGGIDNPAMDMGSMPTGLNLNPSGEVFTLPRTDSRCQLTMEALPREDYYKNNKDAMKRPSIGELHGEDRGDLVSALCRRLRWRDTLGKSVIILLAYWTILKHIVVKH